MSVRWAHIRVFTHFLEDSDISLEDSGSLDISLVSESMGDGICVNTGTHEHRFVTDIMSSIQAISKLKYIYECDGIVGVEKWLSHNAFEYDSSAVYEGNVTNLGLRQERTLFKYAGKQIKDLMIESGGYNMDISNIEFYMGKSKIPGRGTITPNFEKRISGSSRI